MERKASVIRVLPEKLEQYKTLHANTWPAILNKIQQVNIRNYSIFYRDGLLFSYFEYMGSNYEADMLAMAQDPTTQEWWELTNPCQQPVDTALPGEWWAPLQEVFHTQ